MKRILFRQSLACGLAVSALSVFLCSAPDATAASLKKIVAVSRFENKTAYKGQVMLDDGMADQLTDALMQSGQFIVLERQTLGDVMAEQDLAASGRTAKSKSAETGKLTSAQVLIKGTITEFEDKSSGSATGVGFGGVSLGNKREEAHVGLIIRLIDSTTGQVLESQRTEGKATAGGVKLGLNVSGVSFGQEGFSKTPLGKAVQMTIDNAVKIISDKMKNIPFQARVIKVSPEELIVSAGTRTGAAVGDSFTVYSVGEALVDPDTGEQLGSEQKKLGTVKLTDVQEKFARAKPDSAFAAKVGDVIKGN